MRKDYKRLRGWLLYFLIMTILSVVMAFGTVGQVLEIEAVTYGDSFDLFFLLQKLICIVIMVTALLGITSILIKIRKLMTGYFIGNVIFIVMIIIAIAIFPEGKKGFEFIKRGLVIDLIRSIPIAFVWFRYFKVSIRVKEYFGELEIEEQIEDSPDLHVTKKTEPTYIGIKRTDSSKDSLKELFSDKRTDIYFNVNKRCLAMVVSNIVLMVCIWILQSKLGEIEQYKELELFIFSFTTMTLYIISFALAWITIFRGIRKKEELLKATFNCSVVTVIILSLGLHMVIVSMQMLYINPASTAIIMLGEVSKEYWNLYGILYTTLGITSILYGIGFRARIKDNQIMKVYKPKSRVWIKGIVTIVSLVAIGGGMYFSSITVPRIVLRANNYITVDVVGVNNYGRVQVFNNEVEPITHDVQYHTFTYEIMEEVIDEQSYKVYDKNNKEVEGGIKNGDQLTVAMPYNQELLKKNNIELLPGEDFEIKNGYIYTTIEVIHLEPSYDSFEELGKERLQMIDNEVALKTSNMQMFKAENFDTVLSAKQINKFLCTTISTRELDDNNEFYDDYSNSGKTSLCYIYEAEVQNNTTGKIEYQYFTYEVRLEKDAIKKFPNYDRECALYEGLFYYKDGNTEEAIRHQRVIDDISLYYRVVYGKITEYVQ